MALDHEPDFEQQRVNANFVSEHALRAFWELASLEEDVRKQAAMQLVSDLEAAQGTFRQSQPSAAGQSASAAAAEPAEASGDDGLSACAPEVVYCMRRLVKGLGSGRQGARQGFGLALAAALARVPEISTPGVLKLLETCLAAPNGMKGSEARDILMGRAFAYATLIRAGRVRDSETAQRVAKGLLAVSDKRSFLRELSTNIIIELTETLEDPILHDLLQKVEGLSALLTGPAEEATPEALLLALRLWERLPDSLLPSCPLLPAGAPRPPRGFFTAPTPPTQQTLAQTPAEIPAAAGAGTGKKSKKKEKKKGGDAGAEASAGVGAVSGGGVGVGPSGGVHAGAAAAAAFFTPQHMERLVPALRESTAVHPRMHSVWPTLLALLLPGFKPMKDDKAGTRGSRAPAGPGQLEALWRVVVEGVLFQSSHERKFLGFHLFCILLPHLRPNQVEAVFSKAFSRCLVNNLTNPDNYLKAAAARCADRLASFTKTESSESESGGGGAPDPGVRVAVVAALQRLGGVGFDRLTKTKTAAQMLQGLDAEGIRLYTQQLRDAFARPAVVEIAAAPALPMDAEANAEEDPTQAAAPAPSAETGADAGRRWAVEQMVSAVRLPAADAPTRSAALSFLAFHAFFSIEDPAAAKQVKLEEAREAAALEHPISAAVRDLCASRLLTLLDSLDKAAHTKQQQQQQPGKGGAAAAEEAGLGKPGDAKTKDADDVSYLASVSSFVARAAREAGIAPARPLEGPLADSLVVLRSLETRLAKALKKGQHSRPEAAKVRALLTLVRLLGLHTRADPEAADPDLPAELAGVYDNAFGGDGTADADEDDDEEDDDEAEKPAWMDVLLDVLLSLLARPAGLVPIAPLRDAVEAVFRAFCESLTPNGMTDLLRVIGGGAEGAGRSVAEDDVVMDDVASDSEEDEGDASSSDEEEGEGGEGDSSDDDVAAEFDEMLEAADKGDDSGSDAESVDDEAMFAADGKLAAVLRSMNDAKANSREVRQAMRDLEFRALALLDAYIRKVPGSQLLPAALPPLLKLLSKAIQRDDKPLAERLNGLLQNRLVKSRPAAGAHDDSAPAAESDAAVPAGGPEDAETESPEGLPGLFRRVLYLAGRSKQKQVAAAAASGFLYLVRFGLAGGPESVTAAKDAVSAALDDFFTKKRSHLQRKLFEDLAARHGKALGPPMLRRALDMAARARSEYLRREGLALTLSLLRGSKAHAELLAPELRAQLPSLGEAIRAAAAGSFAKASRHGDALLAAASCLEAAQKLLDGQSAATMFGGDGLRSIARALSTARQATQTKKVEQQIKRLLTLTGLTASQLPAAPPPAAKPAPQQPAAKQKAKKAAVAAQSPVEAPPAKKGEGRKEQKPDAPSGNGGKKGKQSKAGGRAEAGDAVMQEAPKKGLAAAEQGAKGAGKKRKSVELEAGPLEGPSGVRASTKGANVEPAAEGVGGKKKQKKMDKNGAVAAVGAAGQKHAKKGGGSKSAK